jgi:hypothetical protein
MNSQINHGTQNFGTPFAPKKRKMLAMPMMTLHTITMATVIVLIRPLL